MCSVPNTVDDDLINNGHHLNNTFDYSRNMATANMVLTSFLVGLLLIPQFYCIVQSDYDGGRVERLIEDDKVVQDLFYQTDSCGTEVPIISFL